MASLGTFAASLGTSLVTIKQTKKKGYEFRF